MSRPLLHLTLILLMALSCACSKRPPIENVLLVSLDSTRADYVDSGLGARAWTPELRRFASGSWVFTNAYSPIPQTLPAHLAVLSGRPPHQLGVFGNEQVYDGRYPLLQQVLQRRGWRTSGIVSLGTLAASTGIARGFDRYRDRMNDASRFYVPAGKVTDTAIGQLARFSGKKFFLFVHYSDPHSPYAPPQAQSPFTIELDGRPQLTFNAYTGTIARLRLKLAPGRHRLSFRTEAPAGDFESFIIRRLQAGQGMELTMENLEFSPAYYGGAHILRKPRGHVTIHARRAGEISLFQVIPILTRNAVLANYRGEVEYMDHHVGRLLNALKNSPEAEHTAVVLFADHGEGLGEREGFIGHVRFLNRQFIRVPLLICIPGETPLRIDEPVSLQALASLLSDVLGVEGSGFPRFAAAWSELRRGRCDRSPIHSFTFAPASGSDLCSVIHWPLQMIVSRNPKNGLETSEYYDLRLAAERKLDSLPQGLVRQVAPDLWRQLQGSRPLWQAAFARRRQPRSKADRHQIEKLKTLGYIRFP